MPKKEYTREQIAEDIVNFTSDNQKFSKSTMTIDWMDTYVAKFQPDKVEDWIKTCLSIPMVDRKIGGKEKSAKNVKAIRNKFLEMFFPDYSDEALKKKKEAEKAKKQAKRAEKEAEKNLTPEEKFRKKMESLKD